MLAALTLVAAHLVSAPAPTEAEVAGAKLSFSVPAGWTKLPALFEETPPAYAPPIYKDSIVPTGPDGRLAVIRDPKSEERDRIQGIWGSKDFQIYLMREIPAVPRDVGETEILWELNYGHDTQFQLAKVRYSGKTAKYWWRGARKIVVKGERLVIVAWRELDRHVDAADAEKSEELKAFYEIVRGFSGK